MSNCLHLTRSTDAINYIDSICAGSGVTLDTDNISCSASISTAIASSSALESTVLSSAQKSMTSVQESTPLSASTPVAVLSSSVALKTSATIPIPVKISTTSHSPFPRWTGSGPLLTGSCATVDFVLLYETTAFLWAPAVGCIDDKPDCCPFSPGAPSVSQPTTTNAIGSDDGFPALNGQDGATLNRCPQDYITVSSTACCPT